MSDQAPLEKELKYSLSKEDYDTLIKATRKRVVKTVKQSNVYFDDSALRLRKKKIGLRVRLEDGGLATLTLKEPAKSSSKRLPKLKIRHEWESRLNLDLAKDLIKGKTAICSLHHKPILILRSHFNSKTLEGILPLGTVKTTRTLVRADKRVLLEIDKFKMFNKKFYELEVETHQPVLADQVVRNLLKKHGIAYLPITKSKLGRFLEFWKKENHR